MCVICSICFCASVSISDGPHHNSVCVQACTTFTPRTLRAHKKEIQKLYWDKLRSQDSSGQSWMCLASRTACRPALQYCQLPACSLHTQHTYAYNMCIECAKKCALHRPNTLLYKIQIQYATNPLSTHGGVSSQSRRRESQADTFHPSQGAQRA